MTLPRAPKVTVSVSITVTETPEGKLDIDYSLPGEAKGTIAGLLGEMAITAMREMMKRVGLDERVTESRTQ